LQLAVELVAHVVGDILRQTLRAVELHEAEPGPHHHQDHDEDRRRHDHAKIIVLQAAVDHHPQNPGHGEGQGGSGQHRGVGECG